jgi:maleate isomerase
MVMLNNIRAATMESVDMAMSMDPGCLIMRMSAETFWDGAGGT